MQRRSRVWILAAAALAAVPASAQTGPTFSGSTEVVASRLGGDAAGVGRREIVLTRDEIRALPVHSIEDLLAILPGVGLARRGAFGAQADLNLRGSTFEQTLVLVNGIRVGNPQTGHHALDLFIPIEAVERIEILFGPASAVHGPGAFGGVINIVTGVTRPAAHIAAGAHGLADGGAGLTVGRHTWAALGRTVHTGFRDDTELAVNQAAAGRRWAAGRTSFEVAAAAGERHFGAWRFYSDRFPRERERTAGTLVTAGLHHASGGLRLDASFRADRHLDTFVLDRRRPAWYLNRHRTDGVLAGLRLAGGRRWRWTVGAEASRDSIRSSSLGRHHRIQTAAFGEAGWFGRRATADLQVRIDHQRPWGSVTTLAAGGSWRPGGGWRLRAAAGQSFRAPSFTELWYRSPASVGDPDLRPERGWTVEVGVGRASWSLTVFQRRAHPLIDFVLDGDGVWRARNVGRLTTSGLEASLLLPVAGPLLWQRLGVEWLGTGVSLDPRRSAYALAHPRLEVAWSGAAAIGGGFEAGWAARFRDPAGRGSWAVLDLRLGRRILDGMRVILEADNLFDRSISELHGIPLPGRWISLRVDWRGGS